MSNSEIQQINANTEIGTIPDKANIFDPLVFDHCERLANVMAASHYGIPDKFKNKPHDCFGVILKALQWNINPYNLIDQCFVLHGKVGYTAKLIIALINSQAPIEGQLDFEWQGDWTQVQGKFKEIKSSSSDATFPVKNWNDQAEIGLACTVSAKLKDGQKKSLQLMLTQAHPRNSTLWAVDPKHQIAYLAAKRWASLYCPQTILGFVTADDIQAEETREKDITPQAHPEQNDVITEIAQSHNTKQAEPVVEQPVSPSAEFIQLEQEIVDATQADQLIVIKEKILKLDLNENELNKLRKTYSIKQHQFEK